MKTHQDPDGHALRVMSGFPNERIREGAYASEDKALQAKVHHGDKELVDYAHDFLRLVLLPFINCRNVDAQGRYFENSPVHESSFFHPSSARILS